MAELNQLPALFWVSLACLGWLAWLGWSNRHRGWGLPVMGVSFTVIAWYHGDVIYNGYETTFVNGFPPSVLNVAWLQVCLFAMSLGIFACFIPDWVNGRYQGRSSTVFQLVSGRRSLEPLQPAIDQLALAVAGAWIVPVAIALWRVNWDVLSVVAPYLGDSGSAWGRGQVAVSWFDSFAAFFGSVNILCAALFGVCAAVLKNGPVRVLMAVLMALSWPGYFFDRTRHVMLVVLLPGLLTYALLRLRGRRVVQLSLLLVGFLAVNFWFKFVIENRTDTTIGTALKTEGWHLRAGLDETKHLGLNMFEELCWIDYLMDTREFAPKPGQLYFANLVNPIPRALWPGKPTIGLDYAVVRGQRGDVHSGVTATIAVGMVGSGVANFGMLIGPIAAAFLMTLWCTFLAWLDLTGKDFGRLLVYVVGCVSIFNFGRDITFLAAYPTLFGFGLLWVYRRFSPVTNLGVESTAAAAGPAARRRADRWPRSSRRLLAR